MRASLHIVAAAACTTLFAAAGSQASLTFYQNFDGTLGPPPTPPTGWDATSAAGDKTLHEAGNGPTREAGKYGQALGSLTYLDKYPGVKYSATSNFDIHHGTLVFWFKGSTDPDVLSANGGAGGQYIASFDRDLGSDPWNATDASKNQFYLQYAWGDYIKFAGRDDNNVSMDGSIAEGFAVGEWHHYALTWSLDSGAHTFTTIGYLDGAQKVNNTFTGITMDNSQPSEFIIGAQRRWSNDGLADGSDIDDFGIYSDVLSQAQIQAIASSNQPLSVPEPASATLLIGAGGLLVTRRRKGQA